jgi:predicted Zn-dependent protease
MMQVWSGLLLRMENEAQLAAVLSHEIGHYLRRHSLERLRDIKSRTAFGQIIGLFGILGLMGQLATLAGALAFSRDHEREADRIGLQLLQRHGYLPLEASRVWQNLIDELRAIPDNDPTQNSVLFATHPGVDERAQALSELAAGMGGDTREAEYRAQIAPLRQGLLEDELKRGRLPESVALLNRMIARESDSAELLHFRGEARRLSGAEAELPLALDDFQAALKAPKPLPLTQRSLGYLYRTLQQPAAARAAWTEYLAQAPNAPDAALIKQTLTEL